MLKYERNILKAKDELMPQAFSEFRPEIKGYYHKGKVHTNSHGFNITSDGIRTETSKGITIVQDIFDGGSSLSNIKAAKNTIFAQRFILKDKEQEVFKDAIEIYADYATENQILNLKKKIFRFYRVGLNLLKSNLILGR